MTSGVPTLLHQPLTPWFQHPVMLSASVNHTSEVAKLTAFYLFIVTQWLDYLSVYVFYAETE